MHPQIPEVALRFRAAPVFATLALVALWPAGTAFGVIGLVFGIGLLGLCAALGLPRSIDLMFGLVLALSLFAAQFLGSVFLGIQAGGATVPVVFTTVIMWFIQLAAVSWDLHRSARTVLHQVTAAEPSNTEAEVRSTGDEVHIGR